jgi:hypothetical protein
MSTTWKNTTYITSWDQFDEHVRSRGIPLLKRLDEFPKSVLVTGCQRSGTTMLTRVITQSAGMVNYWFGPDDELDAALILSGYVDHQPEGRYCFQTTYVNQHFHEYYEHSKGHKIIFVLRNPLSVIYSMLYNWKDHALNRLFNFCGVANLSGSYKWLYKYFGINGVSKLYRACFAYNGKVSQLHDLKKRLGSDQLLVVDYDDIVLNKNVLLPKIYEFIQLDFAPKYSDLILSKSVEKKDKLSKKERSTVSRLCLPVYYDVKKFCDNTHFERELFSS